MEISARNVFEGVVDSVVTGAVNDEVTIRLPSGDTMVSIITKNSAERLNLKKGGKVYAIVKASNVMLAVD